MMQVQYKFFVIEYVFVQVIVSFVVDGIVGVSDGCCWVQVLYQIVGGDFMWYCYQCVDDVGYCKQWWNKCGVVFWFDFYWYYFYVYLLVNELWVVDYWCFKIGGWIVKVCYQLCIFINYYVLFFCLL